MNPLRLVAGLVRFGLAFSGALVRLAAQSLREPDPIDLQPHVLLAARPDGDPPTV